MRVLLVEDDRELAGTLLRRLSQAGYVVDPAGDGVEGEYLGAEGLYDAVVLDLGLPERDGLTVLANWRAAGLTMPVLILTARDAWFERVAGFKAGADDYLGKPFHPEELLARLAALIRRSHGQASATLHIGELSLDEQQQQAIQAGEAIALTATEFRLLRYFMLNAGKILSRTQLEERIHDLNGDRDSNVLEVYINRLRRKLGRERIGTLRGQGYRFEP